MEHEPNTLGVDEVGRGCLFGNVVAAAVMLPGDLPEDGLWKQIKDSKKVSEKKRKVLRDYIMKTAVCYGIGECTAKEIDDINILQASFKAMNTAILTAYKMQTGTIEKIYIDGDRYKPCVIVDEDTFIPHECVVNGDNKILNVAAASILAKCYRDEQIVNGCQTNPIWFDYGFDRNKGYGTKQHFDAIKTYGILSDHRVSFIHL